MTIKDWRNVGLLAGGFWKTGLLLVIVLSCLFRWSFVPGYTLASNDAPLGGLNAEAHRFPQAFFGGWYDLNSIGNREATWPNVSLGLLSLLGPIGYSKFYAPIALLILGLGAWSFFRSLKFAPAACTLGALAAMLNSGFFSVACWGVAAHSLAVGFSFFALAALTNAEHHPYIRIVLGGLAVGMMVCEGVDVGAMFSVFIALFLIYNCLSKTELPISKRILTGTSRLLIVVVCALVISAQALSSLIETNIKGIAGTAQDKETKEQRWDFVTQWSIPKEEALSLLIPGLFGYRLDTPKDMPSFQDRYEGGMYWGKVGRPPAFDRAFNRWIADGKVGPAPQGTWRMTGGGNYPGVLIVLVALWTCVQALRGEESIFSGEHRKQIFFWATIVIIALLLAFGRFAPFFRLVYALPYASTVRNPAKFMHVVNWSLTVLFGFGLHGLIRAYFEPVKKLTTSTHPRLSQSFERKWIAGCGVFLLVSLIAWIVYQNKRSNLTDYLELVGFERQSALGIADFSIKEVAFYLVYLTLGTSLLTLILLGTFRGTKSKIGSVLVGGFILADLGRANQPWIIAWDYKTKYAGNYIVDLLRDKAFEHRVAIADRPLSRVFKIPQPVTGLVQAFDELFSQEWAQHLFLNFNVQSLDIVQMSRVPEDLERFELTFEPDPPKDPGDTQRFITDYLRLCSRKWELTNTRYLLGFRPFAAALNERVNHGNEGFTVVEPFNLSRRSETIDHVFRLQDLVPVPDTNGPLAVIEVRHSLPRAKLYTEYEVRPSAEDALKRLRDSDFDPARTVIISEKPADERASAINSSNSAVEFMHYESNYLKLRTHADGPAVLLLNERFDPNWKLTIDGKPNRVLHCNFIMQGASVPAGEHILEFRFRPPMRLFYVSLAADLVGVLLLGALVFSIQRPVLNKLLPARKEAKRIGSPPTADDLPSNRRPIPVP